MFASLRWVSSAVVVGSMALSAPGAWAASVQYQILNLGAFGELRPTVFDVNDNGQIVGVLQGGDQGDRAFRTAANSPINLATDMLGSLNVEPAGGSETTGIALNNFGQAVGSESSNTPHAWRTAPQAMIESPGDDLGTLDGTYSRANDINESGQVVGAANTAGDWVEHAFRTAANSAINPLIDDLGTLGGDSSEAHAINEQGVVVGESTNAAGQTRAFRTAANSAINPATDDLGTLGGNTARAYDVNDSGQVAGMSTNAAGIQRAFRTSAGGVINAGTDELSTPDGYEAAIALAINGAGHVVGQMSDLDGSNGSRAFVVFDLDMLDLNDLAPANSGWRFTSASAINERGQIAVNGTYNGQRAAALLTPVAAPAPIPLPAGVYAGLIAMGCAAPIMRRRTD